jgi:hypothetical protein
MKIYKLTLCLIGMSLLNVKASDLDKPNLDDFATCEIVNEGIRVTLLKKESRWIFQVVDEGMSVAVLGGESVVIPFDKKSCFAKKHISITFTQQEKPKKFLVTKSLDHRSFGKSLDDYNFVLDASSGNIRFSDAPQKNTTLLQPSEHKSSAAVNTRETSDSVRALLQEQRDNLGSSATLLQAPNDLPSRSLKSPQELRTEKSKEIPQREESAASTPWSIIGVLIVAALGLLWLLLKRRS